MKSIFLTLGSIVFLAVAGMAGVTFFAPDLALRLRSQAVPATEGPSTLTKELRWTPNANTPLGAQVMTFTARDGRGGTGTRQVVVAVAGQAACGQVEITPGPDRARIQCRTGQPTRPPRIKYDVSSQLRESVEPADPAEATEHNLEITGLLACTTYQVQVNESVHAFTTTGCTGDAAIRGTASEDIAPGAEGEVALDSKVTVRVPAAALPAAASLQIQQLDRAQALAALGTPSSNLSPVTGLYQLTAYTGPRTIVSAFNEPVTVTVAYTPAPGTNLASLALWRHDGAAWSQLDGCAADEAARTISCTTTQFSVVAGFASGGSSDDEEPEPSAAPSPTPASTSSEEEEEEEEIPAPAANRSFIYQAETGWAITGAYSGVQGSVVKLAGPRDIFLRTITAPEDDYYVYLKAKHDRPGPVTAAVYAAPQGGRLKAWKVIKLDKNDDNYYTHRLGRLSAKDFPGGVYQISLRLLNDSFDRQDPANEASDRNLWVDWLMLSNQSSLAGVEVVDGSAAGGPGPAAGGGRSSGWGVLPRLNRILREEQVPVTVENWKYYAWRLTVPAGHRAAVQSESRLRAVMRYWRAARPQDPRGDIF